MEICVLIGARDIMYFASDISAFSFFKKGLEAEIGGRWRHLAEGTQPFDRPTGFAFRLL
jgi:hypothetical protein